MKKQDTLTTAFIIEKISMLLYLNSFILKYQCEKGTQHELSTQQSDSQ